MMPIPKILGVFVCLAFVPAAVACDTPVYRYALARWASDPFRLNLTPGTKEQQPLVERLRQARHTEPSFNLLVEEKDTPSSPPGTMTLFFPSVTGLTKPIWSASLSPENLDILLDSPLRRELVRRLQAEETVWLFLPWGEAKADEEARSLVRETLKQQSGKSGQPPASFLEMNRADSRERLLIDLLLATEEDLRTRKEPLVFPVFGRGRVLYALAGSGIHEGNIRKALAFLGGACSCTVKKENPGVDLPLQAVWRDLPIEEEPVTAALTELPVEVSDGTPRARATPPPHSPRFPLVLAVGVAGLFVILTGAGAIRRARGSS